MCSTPGSENGFGHQYRGVRADIQSERFSGTISGISTVYHPGG